MVAAYTPPVPVCVVQAATDYSIPLRGFLSVMLQEGGRVGQQVRNTDGTYDHGPMQINTRWVRVLTEKFNLNESQITNDFCMNIRAGAYILRYYINEADGNFWEGVGYYHSHTPHLKTGYISEVYKKSLSF